ncbi:phosphomannomutase [Propionicimonas paludicola]|uniref:Phosphomannomutase n=1 Tax=Propionicimonas paludicola TaxID=185243 RepID=A0A2A9CP64_9ACTN|nr:phospho-sugar mutase [Propionicimonas paludicola]PFG15875.1 phosphomannomutase [Propionicimonas paludicola]
MSHELIQAWLRDDPDPATAAELRGLLERAEAGDAAAEAELSSAFAGRLEFGTAGLRGRLGPGPARMNRVLVSQAAAGLALYLLDQGLAGSPVVVGHDARHNSAVFAKDTAEILAGAGLRPLLCDRALPTPVVAFGIGHFSCAAAVVVTASHNPPQDNGYKVYLGDGSQIVPPADAEIAARIDAAAARPLAEIPRSDDYRMIGDDLVAGYLARAASLVDPATPRELNWVYTAMHGVGGAIVDQLVAATGFPAPHQVAEQQQPDPDFPTVAFPNPEEPGAIDLALALARTVEADIAIANDPDADRCAIAAPFAGTWRMLSGDELGWLLADDALRRSTAGVYACSVVSSTLLATMAAAHGQPFQTTLTGFKWIGRVPGLVFGYEEAIGYCTDPAAVPDKDGITTALRVLALAARLKADGSSIAERLDQIATDYGVHLTSQLSFRVSDLSLITAAMARIRQAPPAALAGEPVEVVDLARGSADLLPTDGVLFSGRRVRVVVRPSGTEPKLKCYLQVALAPGADLAADRAQASTLMSQARDEMARALGL